MKIFVIENSNRVPCKKCHQIHELMTKNEIPIGSENEEGIRWFDNGKWHVRFLEYNDTDYMLAVDTQAILSIIEKPSGKCVAQFYDMPAVIETTNRAAKLEAPWKQIGGGRCQRI
jgi:hypothetical protein